MTDKIVKDFYNERIDYLECIKDYERGFTAGKHYTFLQISMETPMMYANGVANNDKGMPCRLGMNSVMLKHFIPMQKVGGSDPDHVWNEIMRSCQ